MLVFIGIVFENKLKAIKQSYTVLNDLPIALNNRSETLDLKNVKVLVQIHINAYIKGGKFFELFSPSTRKYFYVHNKFFINSFVCPYSTKHDSQIDRAYKAKFTVPELSKSSHRSLKALISLLASSTIYAFQNVSQLVDDVLSMKQTVLRIVQMYSFILIGIY